MAGTAPAVGELGTAQQGRACAMEVDRFTRRGQKNVGANFKLADACVDDIYDGKMVLRGADEFTWSWRISGPDKDGEICTRYTRDRDASAPL